MLEYMKIIIEIAHPAHVHQFKHTIWNLKNHGHNVKIVAIDKDITLYLLDVYGFKYTILGKNYKTLMKKAFGLVRMDYKLFKVAKKFKPDIFVSRGLPYSAHVSKVLRRPNITFCDTEHAKLTDMLSYPFVDVICTPSCYKKRLNSKKHIKYEGYKELAYLHPHYFKPDPSVLEDMGLSTGDRFIIIRLVSWDASHDLRSKGFSNEFLEQSIKLLEDYGNVFITSERKLNKNLEKYSIVFPPEQLHSALYYASLYVGDGGTVAVESAILGTPSVHVASVKLASGEVIGASQIHGNFDELVNKYNMLYSYSDQKQAMDKALEILQCDTAKKELEKKRKKLLNDKIDVTAFMTDFIERYPESFYECREQVKSVD